MGSSGPAFAGPSVALGALRSPLRGLLELRESSLLSLRSFRSKAGVAAVTTSLFTCDKSKHTRNLAGVVSAAVCLPFFSCAFVFSCVFFSCAFVVIFLFSERKTHKKQNTQDNISVFLPRSLPQASASNCFLCVCGCVRFLVKRCLWEHPSCYSIRTRGQHQSPGDIADGAGSKSNMHKRLANETFPLSRRSVAAPALYHCSGSHRAQSVDG